MATVSTRNRIKSRLETAATSFAEEIGYLRIALGETVPAEAAAIIAKIESAAAALPDAAAEA